MGPFGGGTDFFWFVFLKPATQGKRWATGVRSGAAMCTRLDKRWPRIESPAPPVLFRESGRKVCARSPVGTAARRLAVAREEQRDGRPTTQLLPGPLPGGRGHKGEKSPEGRDPLERVGNGGMGCSDPLPPENRGGAPRGRHTGREGGG